MMEQASGTRVSLLMRVRDSADTAAWAEFDKRYGPLILAYCRARGCQHTDAEDIRQLVMAKLASRLRTFEYHKECGGFRRYLRTVTRGEMARHASGFSVRLGHYPFDADSFDEQAQATDDDDAVWEREWMRHHFRIAWETVKEHSDESSLAVFRQLLSGVAPRRIAQATGMSEPAIRKIKQRMCDRLRAAIAEQILDEEQNPSI